MLPSCEMVRRAGVCWASEKCERLKRILVAFAGANAQCRLDRDDEDLAVTDPTGLRSGGNRLHDAFGHRVFDDDFQLYLRQEVDDIFGAAIEFGMALLATETLGFGDGDAADTDFVQGFLHFVEFERLDDRLNLLHAFRPPLGWPPPFAHK